MKLKEYLRQLKPIVEKEGYNKSDKWELYNDLYILQALEKKHNIELLVKNKKK